MTVNGNVTFKQVLHPEDKKMTIDNAITSAWDAIFPDQCGNPTPAFVEKQEGICRMGFKDCEDAIEARFSRIVDKLFDRQTT
jgi:hypothetical protein